MNKLELKLRNYNDSKYVIYLDGKKAKFKKGEFHNYIKKYETENSEVELKICSIKHELSGNFWLLLYLLYFIVSFFGIFDSHYSKVYYELNYIGKIKVNENTQLDLMFVKPYDNKPAIEIKSGDFDNNESNKFIYHKNIKTRVIITRIIGICTWVLISILAVFKIISKF